VFRDAQMERMLLLERKWLSLIEEKQLRKLLGTPKFQNIR
jgi:hypothetical protein